MLKLTQIAASNAILNRIKEIGRNPIPAKKKEEPEIQVIKCNTLDDGGYFAYLKQMDSIVEGWQRQSTQTGHEIAIDKLRRMAH